MRSAALFIEILMLLPIAFVRPIVGVVLFSWISFMNPHQLVFGGVGAELPWALLICLVTLIGYTATREPKRFPVNAMTVLIMMFLVMITFTTMFALAPFDQVLAKYELIFKMFFFLLVTAALLTSRERIHAMVWIMAISLAYFGIKGGGFTLMGGGADRVYGPPASMITDNNHLAAGLLIAMPLMNYLRMESRHAVIRYGFLAAMALTLLAVLGSYSRGAFLALGAVAVYFWLKSPAKIISGALVAIALVAALTFMPEGWYDRMYSIEHYQQDYSAMGRLEIWHVAWVIATSRPLVGGGFMATYFQPVVDQFVPGVEWRAVHSIWLEVLAEHGFPTFFVWLGINITAAVYAHRIIRQATGVPGLEWCVNLARMAQVSMIAYVTGGSFLSLSYWDYYYTILVIVGATYEHVKATVSQARPASRWAARVEPARSGAVAVSGAGRALGA